MYTHWFGLPYARRRRITQSIASLIAEVEGDVALNTTDSEPWSRARARSRAATVSRASSQVMAFQPGSPDPFGAVRLSGCSSRSAWVTSSGAVLPLIHSAWPVGCEGSGCSAVKAPSLIVAFAPHRETHRGQNVGTCSVTWSTVIAAPSRGPR
ncbi:hypothetical protein BH20ACT6_BH20ACT6_21600 [soil metagenome]